MDQPVSLTVESGKEHHYLLLLKVVGTSILIQDSYVAPFRIRFLFILLDNFVLHIKHTKLTLMIRRSKFCIGIASNMFTIHQNCFSHKLRYFQILLLLASPQAQVIPFIKNATCNRPSGVSKSIIYLFVP